MWLVPLLCIDLEMYNRRAVDVNGEAWIVVMANEAGELVKVHCSVVKLEEEEAKGDVMSEETTGIPRHSS